jgi:hypothetical protein
MNGLSVACQVFATVAKQYLNQSESTQGIPARQLLSRLTTLQRRPFNSFQNGLPADSNAQVRPSFIQIQVASVD